MCMAADAVACMSVASVFCHGAAVKRIKWVHSGQSSAPNEAGIFASCGEDHSIRVHRIHLSPSSVAAGIELLEDAS